MTPVDQNGVPPSGQEVQAPGPQTQEDPRPAQAAHQAGAESEDQEAAAQGPPLRCAQVRSQGLKVSIDAIKKMKRLCLSCYWSVMYAGTVGRVLVLWDVCCYFYLISLEENVLKLSLCTQSWAYKLLPTTL